MRQSPARSAAGVENLTHLAGQRLRREWLLQEEGAGIEESVADDGVIAVA